MNIAESRKLAAEAKALSQKARAYSAFVEPQSAMIEALDSHDRLADRLVAALDRVEELERLRLAAFFALGALEVLQPDGVAVKQLREALPPCQEEDENV